MCSEIWAIILQIIAIRITLAIITAKNDWF